MNLDLTAQFIRDYEELRDRTGAECKSCARHQAELVRLQAELERLQAIFAESQAANAALLVKLDKAKQYESELSRLRAAVTRKMESLQQSHTEELEQKERKNQLLADELAFTRKSEQEVEALKRRLEAQYAEKTQGLEARAKEKLIAERDKLVRLYRAKLETAQQEALKQVESKLAALASMPLGTRVAALILDVLLLVTAAHWWTTWDQTLTFRGLALGTVSVFCLRAFVSPGRLLLGITPRRIGPEHRPIGPVALVTRFYCGLLHYGPLLASALVVLSDPARATALMDLATWAGQPSSNAHGVGAIINEVLRPDKFGLAGVVLAATLVWWAILLVSLLWSSLIHSGAPYFRNTTLVESLWNVGFQRFSPPLLAPTPENHTA